MGGNRNFGAFVIMDLIFLVVFFGLVLLVFDLTRISFILEVMLLLALLLIVMVALIGVYNNLRWGYVLSSLLFAVILVDLLLIHFRNPAIGLAFFVTTVMAAVGFIISIVGIKEDEIESEEPEPATGKKEVEPKTKFTPGKYVTSKRSDYYHTPKCDWAKKIKKNNQLWLSDEEVKERGLKKHSCLE